jgi:DNA-directed RNA polymerase subunit RPC12/RpoP
MPHGPLICRDCFAETEIETSGNEPALETGTGFVCPDCGSKSFSI